MARTALFPISAVLLAASSAFADPVVFSNGAADIDHGSGREMTAWMQADDFMLSHDTTVTGMAMQWFTLDRLSSWDHTIQWTIFADLAGAPGSVVGQGGALNVLTEFDGARVYDRYTTSFEFDAPVALAAGTKYWLGLHFSANFNRDDLYWADSVDGQLGHSMESLGGTLNNWMDVSGMDRAFSLIPSPGPVGLAACAGLLTARRRQA